MRIDADTHISPIVSDITIQVETLLSDMQRSQVDKSLCWLQPPYMRETDDSLRYVYEATRRYADRLLGFGWVDPHLGIDKGRDTIRRCVEEYGFYGIKLNGAQNSFYIDDEQLSLPIVEEVAKTSKILAFHVGADEYDYTHPYRVAKIAQMYPQMTILMVHMGGAGVPDIANSCIEVAQKHPNTHLIGSNVNLKKVRKAIEILGAHRVCFGSDTPFFYMHAEVCAYEAFLSDFFTPQERDLVMGGNITRLLGI